ncbi:MULTISPECIES: copper resistance CopC family protein [Cryobacterium]|uniref:Copper resistance protein CopC n=1 Tax=Cryobacterium breve TaxID=1259258 RepID=A0ABY2IX72_9MICO|nr:MULTISPECIES: copper resistance CopC family protein [Cryobacterium]TFC94843.1 copper resistance protein CopC [Cryobacterium breve]TFC94973.1 copper resistance protein CopC [Cryobacterium sp. TmT3-12]
MTHAFHRRPATGVLLTLTVIALSVLGPMAPAAYAHDQVQSTLPADGEHVDSAPSAVTITFTDDILEIGAVILVVDDEERDWAEGEMRLDGSQGTQAVELGMPDGAYQVRWRVVSADGHPVSGAFAFAVGDAVLPDAGAGAGATATPEPSPDAQESAAADDAAAAADTGTGLPLAVVGLIGALGGLAIFALFTVWRAKRHRNP